MIAACPKCTARYRVDESRIGAGGAKLKCAKCQALFRVLAPPQTAPEPAPETTAPETTAPETTAPKTTAPKTTAPGPPAVAPPPSASDGAVVDRERLVVVADPDVEAGKATVAKLAGWGLQPILVHDGVEAMLTIQRMLPRAVILDAALPKMYGFQVCEVIKRNESLRHTGVILVGAVHNQDRYRRQPAELYGADHYIEQPDLPDGLGPLFIQMGMELPARSDTAAPASVATPAPPPEPVAAEPPVAPAPQAPAAETPVAPAAAPDDSPCEEQANAERLARIIVSDIALYQPEKFAEAIDAGNPVEAMDAEIEEGRSLFAQRIDERVRAERDFIVDELLRVARQRGMQ
ncbi:MAG: hypothetical protein GY733_21715 [bacterium]|nr:hypothetical protein [bacterium]